MKNEKLVKAKTELVLDQPFFASILLNMPLIEDANVSTMATDGETVRFNPAFLDTLTQKETVFVLAHETLHCVFQHMFRQGDRDHEQWNIATDHVINDLLIQERVGTMPKGGLHDAALVKTAGGLAERVYDLLPKPPKGQNAPKPGESGGALDDLMQPQGDAAQVSQKESELKQRIAQARNAAKLAGKLSAGLERLATEAIRSKTDWRAVLRKFLNERAKVELTYARPKRRFLADDIYLPSLTGEKLGAIVVAVDCSGSIDAETLGKFQNEIRAIVQDICPAETRVLYFDTDVSHRETFGPDQVVTLQPHGGGGTAFSPIFEALQADAEAPVACVVLTDLYCDDFGEAPDFPVLWACTNDKNTVPFGEVVRLED